MLIHWPKELEASTSNRTQALSASKFNISQVQSVLLGEETVMYNSWQLSEIWTRISNAVPLILCHDHELTSSVFYRRFSGVFVWAHMLPVLFSRSFHHNYPLILSQSTFCGLSFSWSAMQQNWFSLQWFALIKRLLENGFGCSSSFFLLCRY